MKKKIIIFLSLLVIGLFIFFQTKSAKVFIPINKTLPIYLEFPESKIEKVPSDIINKLESTKSLNIKIGNHIYSTNSDKAIKEFISIFKKSSTTTNSAYLCDAPGIAIDFLDKDSQIIDTAYLYRNSDALIDNLEDGMHYERFMLSSLESSSPGCKYFSVYTDVSFIDILERVTDYIFFNIYNYSEESEEREEVIYIDGENTYYFKNEISDKVYIEFIRTKEKILLKDALNQRLISPKEVREQIPDLLYVRPNN